MKFRSHWPSVTPSARVLVRFPLHVILTVEAAFPAAIAPRTSEIMQRDVRRFDICDHNSGAASMRVFYLNGYDSGNGIGSLIQIKPNGPDYSALCDLDCCCSASCASSSFARF